MIAFRNAVLGRGEFALRADWNLPARSRTAVIGPSGAGKTTLLSALAGFTTVLSGKLLIGGADMDGVLPSQRPVTMLFQENNLFPGLTAMQNAALGLRGRLDISAQERETVRAALARTGLAGLEDRKPEALSGGQRSRVALARTLLMRRPVLALDEPFSALGPGLRQEMLAEMMALAEAENMTVMMVTHDPEEARRFADHLIVVADGAAEAPKDPEAAFAHPTEALRDYLGQRN